MAIELGRLHQAHDNGGTPPSEFASTEEPCFSAHGPATNQVFAMVVVYRYVAVDQIVRERGPRAAPAD